MFKKALLIASVALISSPALATTCKTKLGTELGALTVELVDQNNGLYIISQHGQSRNTYKALYQSVGPNGQINKIADYSTWQDMPEQLTLHLYEFTHGLPGYSYFLRGLVPSTIQFNEYNNCVP